MASKTDYKKLLDGELDQLRTLIEERRSLKNRLDAISEDVSRLREGVIGLAALAHVDLKATHPDIFSAPVKADIGLTDAIRSVLMDSMEFMTPTEVREALFLGEIYPIHQHKNPLASIHSVLKRLADSGQVVVATDEDTKKTVYAWADSYPAIRAKLDEEDVAEK
jgi:hypothetical protein